jgi:hypothetical protein
MTLAPRFLVKFWAGWRTARFARRLKSPGHDRNAQHRAFAARMAQLAATAFGRQHGLTAATPYEQFRVKVPPRTYAHFQPFIARMIRGEPGVLAPGRCPFFVETAGATGAATKILPAPAALFGHFRTALAGALALYARRARRTDVFLGRHLHLGTSTAASACQGAYRVSFDGLVALCLPPWVAANLYAPPGEVAQLPEGPAKARAAAEAMRRSDVTLIAGTPADLCALTEAVHAAASGDAHSAPFAAVWPNLECCLHTGAPLGLHGDILRAALGPGVTLHEVYAAAEGVFAAQDGAAPSALRLLADTGVFFEFLPLSAYHEAKVESAGAQCLPLEGLQPGTDYVPVVTTPAGLCRYVTGDVVRFASVEPPRLQVAGRAGLQLDALGERVTERDVLDTLQAVCARHGWHPISFHVAPYVQRLGPGQLANVHEWWLELRTHSVRTPLANVLGPELDTELCRRNHNYAARRANGSLGLPLVRLVMPGLFAHWAQEQGRAASASKLPRCRPDRLIADQLAALAPFYQDRITPARPT